MPQKKPTIYLSPPHMSGNEMKYIREAFDQNWISPLGPNVDAFEDTLAHYCGVDHAAVLSSGTAAIHLSLILLGIKTGDKVLVPTFTFSATVNPVVYQGATPVMIDSETDSWNMDPELLEKAIREESRCGSKRGNAGIPKAIIVAHLYGMPASMEDIMAIAAKYGIPVIEDAAEALGSQYMDRSVGSFGIFGVLSFNGNKIITTSGGGALLSNEKGFIEKARFLATQARDKARHYQHSEIGYNYRLSNILAGIGRGQMEVLEQRVKQRRSNFIFYHDNLGKIPGIEFLTEPDERYFSNYWLTNVLIDHKITGVSKNDILDAFEKENIEARPLWKPMHMQPVFEKYPAYVNGVSEDLFNKGLCLPSGSIMTQKDRKRVVDIIIKYIK